MSFDVLNDRKLILSRGQHRQPRRRRGFSDRQRTPGPIASALRGSLFVACHRPPPAAKCGLEDLEVCELVPG